MLWLVWLWHRRACSAAWVAAGRALITGYYKRIAMTNASIWHEFEQKQNFANGQNPSSFGFGTPSQQRLLETNMSG